MTVLRDAIPEYVPSLGTYMRYRDPVCTDPSHPAIYEISNPSLLELVSNQLEKFKSQDVPEEEATDHVVSDVLNRLSGNSRNWVDGPSAQSYQRYVAEEWGDVLQRVEGLGWLVGWFINGCAQDRGTNDLHHVLCTLAMEANQVLFVLVHMLRGGLANEAFTYLRRLHESLVKSRFIKDGSRRDPDLPRRFIYYTNKSYVSFYERFDETEGADDPKQMWLETEEQYKSSVIPPARGDYAWAYPLIVTPKGEPKKRPTFYDLVNEVDPNSRFTKSYYDVASDKIHGALLWNPLMIRPDARRFKFDPFDGVEHTLIVIDLMLPMYEEVVRNTSTDCSTSSHRDILRVVRALVNAIRDSALTKQ